MVKNIAKIGNSQGIVFDASLLRQARLQVGDSMNIEVHAGGTITLTPIRSEISPEEARASAKEWMRKNAELFRRLS